MLRLILVLAFAFLGSQFPAYYQSYIVQVDNDLRSALASGAPDAVVATLNRQRADLLYAEPVGWPIALAEAWDGDRAVAAFAAGWNPHIPEDGIEWAYGAAGLFAGYFVTAILFALFGGRPAPARVPAARISAPAQAPAPARTTRSTERPARPRAAVQSADTASPWAPRPESVAQPPPSSSRIPAAGDKLAGGSLIQAAGRLARETAREAGQEARELVREHGRQQAVQAEAAERHVIGPRTGQNAVETRFRSAHVIEFRRPRLLDAITMSYARPPLIVRRREMRDLGPIERVTILRD